MSLISEDRSTQLFDTIRTGDAGQVRALLVKDPKLGEARNKDGVSAVLWAMYTRHGELAEMLLGSRQPDFYEACALGRLGRVEELLVQDPTLATGDSADGFSGLGLAIFFGYEAVAHRLVEAGADVNRPSSNSFRVSPLHSAVASGKLALVELLLSHGALPDQAEFLEATPLHSAAGHGNREMVRRLIEAGADFQRKTKEGKTAAELARQYGHIELAEELEK